MSGVAHFHVKNDLLCQICMVCLFHAMSSAHGGLLSFVKLKVKAQFQDLSHCCSEYVESQGEKNTRLSFLKKQGSMIIIQIIIHTDFLQTISLFFWVNYIKNMKSLLTNGKWNFMCKFIHMFTFSTFSVWMLIIARELLSFLLPILYVRFLPFFLVSF